MMVKPSTKSTEDNMGPTLQISKEIHQEKYRSDGESFRDAMNRIAGALKEDETHFHALRDILLDMRFLPAGRVQTAIGSLRKTTPYNCFVAPKIEDNFTSENGIMDCAKKAAETMRMGGGIGYDFSTLRPRGTLIKSINSAASGPVSFMNIFSELCHTIASAGHRRGAQMGVLRVDHPDIELFIRAKQSEEHSPNLWSLVGESGDQKAFQELQATHKLTGFNVSVAITDEFMLAVKANSSFNLEWEGRMFNSIPAKCLWELLMRSTWDWAEPGVLFIDTCNKMNNLHYCETLATSNPCGEQPLPPNGACLLGSFNLVKYLELSNKQFNWQLFISDIDKIVRAMDNVIDQALYPLEAQELEAKRKRRMGLGVTGLANTLEFLGHSYGSEGFLKMEADILRTLRNTCYRLSVQLAKEKGSFPLFARDSYLDSGFIKTLPEELQELIYKHGIRNSHLTSIAPTGTISLTADNISSGIEPVFTHEYERTINTFEGTRKEMVKDYGWDKLKVKGKTAEECSIEDHLNVLLEAQKYVDSAVSKTCNVSPNTNWEDFKSIYMKAWEGGAKGCTTFNSGGKRTGVLQAACYIDPETGKRECE